MGPVFTILKEMNMLLRKIRENSKGNEHAFKKKIVVPDYFHKKWYKTFTAI